ncbi:MAG: bifunctional proline dehydrogenase/L-glutamate gamma-semialdehyde dehydrogenase PutA [Pseudomonadota bacterium]
MSAERDSLFHLREAVRNNQLAPESERVAALVDDLDWSLEKREAVTTSAAELVRHIRSSSTPGLMESFLGEYGLSTDEGVALMCLAEALLRVPDADTIDALIEDKIAPSDWGKHLGHSSSPLVNASTWALLITGRVLDTGSQGLAGILRGSIKRLGEPVIRTAVAQAMKMLGEQFVLGETIERAIDNGKPFTDKGYTYSFDMLGEAARTETDARRYHLAYSHAISAMAKQATGSDIRSNPGISIKLSALHPRYEYLQRERVMEELAPRVKSLVLLAQSAGIGLNIDAEEADRLELSLDVIEAVLADPALEGWDGFGVVVQAFGQRAPIVIDWLYELSNAFNRRIMVRLVKGAYWDTEIKRAQTLGLDGFPVFTRKCATDLSYLACAKKLLACRDRIYPQFATHNAHTVSGILAMTEPDQSYEFQRLHGMGEALYEAVLQRPNTRCRIYAPVGAHEDLLAYLVRRLLENGANSSFVNQIVDETIPPEMIAEDPIGQIEAFGEDIPNPAIVRAGNMYAPKRRNSRGYDLSDPVVLEQISAQRIKFQTSSWQAGPLICGKVIGAEAHDIVNPASPSDNLGTVREASPGDVETALGAAQMWNASPQERSDVLNRAADLYEVQAPELFALACREAGKTLADCVNELREAVDFLRFYASEALRLNANNPRGTFACISPWNFPLAIFTGQISAALAAGNAVIAKPAEATPLIAHCAVELLHEAGVPKSALQFCPGTGAVVGGALSADPRIAGLCFTGSTATAMTINRAMAENVAVDAPLIAETGGLNAMIVDSTALPEQAVRDIVASAFQSAGQRCSALRVLYVQNDIADKLLTMLQGAMDELVLGDPWDLATDIGPVIDAPARHRIASHIEQWTGRGKLIKSLDLPGSGHFVGPTLIEISGISDLEEEIFGPVLHVARFKADELDRVIEDINATGYGLTFGLHTRIDDRVQSIVDRVNAGNIYVNRNQIGAVVGTQPFGGEGLSGTGPKAGGPAYVKRFTALNDDAINHEIASDQPEPAAAQSMMTLDQLQTLVDRAGSQVKASNENEIDCPGPTGESNRLSTHPKGVVLCLGPEDGLIAAQKKAAEGTGCAAIALEDGAAGSIDPDHLRDLDHIAAIVCGTSHPDIRDIRKALAERSGQIIPLICDHRDSDRFLIERHVCVDTTASGGNAELLAANE